MKREQFIESTQKMPWRDSSKLIFALGPSAVRGLDAVLIKISQYSVKSLDTFPALARECERLGKVAGNFSFRKAYEVDTNA